MLKFSVMEINQKLSVRSIRFTTITSLLFPTRLLAYTAEESIRATFQFHGEFIRFNVFLTLRKLPQASATIFFTVKFSDNETGCSWQKKKLKKII